MKKKGKKKRITHVTHHKNVKYRKNFVPQILKLRILYSKFQGNCKKKMGKTRKMVLRGREGGMIEVNKKNKNKKNKKKSQMKKWNKLLYV